MRGPKDHFCHFFVEVILGKLCPGKNPVPQPQPTPEQSRVEVQRKHLPTSGPSEWTEVVKRGDKAANPPPKQVSQKNALPNSSNNNKGGSLNSSSATSATAIAAT